MTTEADEFASFASTVTSSPAPAVETEADPSPETGSPPESPETDPAAKEAAEKAAKEKTDWKEIAAREKAKREARAAKRDADGATQRELVEARAKAARYDALLGKVKENPLEALPELGVSFDDVTARYLADLEKNPDKEPPPSAEQKRIAELESRIAAQEKRETIAELQRTEANRKEILRSLDTQVGETIAAKIEDFELLSRKPQGREIVINLLALHHAENNGQVLDIQEACAKVEAHLREEFSPFADSKFVRTLVDGKSPTTLSSGMREGDVTSTTTSDDNKDFLDSALRLLKQNSP